jgi:Clostridial hydrophobic W
LLLIGQALSNTANSSISPGAGAVQAIFHSAIASRQIRTQVTCKEHGASVIYCQLQGRGSSRHRRKPDLPQATNRCLSVTRTILVAILLSSFGASVCLGQVRYGILDETHWSEVADGALAGSTKPGPQTTGFYLRGLPFRAEYRIYVQDTGWLPWVSVADSHWTSGSGKRLEAIQFRFPDGIPDGTKLKARALIQDSGFTFPVNIENDTVIGTPGQNHPIEGIQIAEGSGPQAERDIANSFIKGQFAAAPPNQPASPPPYKTFTSGDMNRWDCVMHGTTVTFYPNGTGHFEAQVMTKHTMTSDILHQTIFVKGNGGVSLFNIPNHDSPNMQTQNRYFGGPSSWYPFSYDFTFPANLYDQITTLELSCGC